MPNRRTVPLLAGLLALLLHAPAHGLGCPFARTGPRTLLQAPPPCDVAALAEANRQGRPPPPGSNHVDSADWAVKEVCGGMDGPLGLPRRCAALRVPRSICPFLRQGPG